VNVPPGHDRHLMLLHHRRAKASLLVVLLVDRLALEPQVGRLLLETALGGLRGNTIGHA